MPASTCWQCRAVVRAARPANALATAAEVGRLVFPCRAQHGGRGLYGDERLGQAMAHRLELADELTELGSLQCVLPGQLQHLPGGADQFVPPASWPRATEDGHAGTTTSAAPIVQGGGDLDQFELGVHAVDPAQRSGPPWVRRRQECVTVAGDHDRLFVVH